MKKFVLLVLGLCAAGLAAWAVPRELDEQPLKKEVLTIIQTVTIDQAVTVVAVAEYTAPVAIHSLMPAEKPLAITAIRTSHYRWQALSYFVKQEPLNKAEPVKKNLDRRLPTRLNL